MLYGGMRQKHSRIREEALSVEGGRHKRTRGFTLVEALVVVAIIAILIGIAVPVFTAQLEKVRQTTCADNLRSQTALLTVAYLDGGEEAVKDAYQTSGGDYTCPSGGHITYHLDAGGHVSVYCSRHAVETSLGDNTTIGTVTDILKKYSTGQLDSGAAGLKGSHTTQALEALAKGGLDLNALGAVSWRYVTQNKSLYWSTLDINDYDTGDQVLVIKYTTSSPKYSVWTATVDMTTSNGSTYKTLTPGDNSPGNVVFNGTTSYEDALAAYQKALTARALT